MLQKIKNLFSRSTPSPATHAFWRSMATPLALSGIKVTCDTAMRHAAVYACVKVLSETIASLPLNVYERKSNKTTKASAHPLYNLLHNQPNNDMTSYSWRQIMVTQDQLHGNHYSQIIRTNGGKVVGLYPLNPTKMQIMRNKDGEIVYKYTADDGEVALTRNDVLHIVGFSYDGITGISQIIAGANTIGLSMAMEQFGSEFFKNGAHGSGVLKLPQTLSDEAYQRLSKAWGEKYTGIGNSNKPIILEGGADWTSMTISNEQSQFLESRKFQIADIARIFRVPLHMINELDKATFSNIEHQSIEFVRDTIRPIATRIEQAMNAKLFSEAEREKYFVKFNLDALLRGDTKSRYEAYGMAIRDGWMSRNEARGLEDLNPEKGLDEFILPLNMTKEGKNED